MNERRGIRRIIPRFQDYFGDGLSLQQPATNVSEARIASFCKGCDHLGDNGGCPAMGDNDQARYAARGWCGGAVVDGKRGEMKTEGFKQYSK